MKVSLFATCLVDLFQTNAGKATVELLEHLGCEVEFPRKQICCGQPAYNSGHTKNAEQAMKHMIETFEDAEVIVCPSGSCAYMFKEYPKVFKHNPAWQYRAQRVADKTYELTEFIVDVLGITDVGATFNDTITYHSSCHMTRLLGVKTAPLQLLENVRGLTYSELPNRTTCCGFGGTFSVKMTAISEQMVDEKVQHIVETGAHYLIGADEGCLMNIRGRAERLGTDVKVLHIAEILNNRVAKEVF